MKRIQNLGKNLSAGEKKLIFGGKAALAKCTVSCRCSATLQINASCWDGVTSCSATDGTGITCNSSNFSCSYICTNYS